MDTRSEIREFLTSRRARLKAADVGLPAYGARRVPGLRRQEVAVLAGVSVLYYTRLERGDVAGVSDSMLDAVAPALRLDDAERAPVRSARIIILDPLWARQGDGPRDDVAIRHDAGDRAALRDHQGADVAVAHVARRVVHGVVHLHGARVVGS
jgi:transcriptional regulator with XRE-family HTH domain